MRISGLFRIALCISLVGCGGLGSNELREEYLNNARKLGLSPVYPPREDIQVGDVFVVWSPKSADHPDNEVITYSHSDRRIVKAAEKYLANRIVFRKSVNTDGNGNNDTGPQPDLYGNADHVAYRYQKAVESLPIVAYPDLTADAGYSAGLGVVQALQALGLAGGARTTVSLSFNDVRKFAVPRSAVLDNAIDAAFDTGFQGSAEITDAERKQIAFENELARFELARQARKRRDALPADICDWHEDVRIVTTVYLTREITYTYRNARIVGAALKRAESGESSAATAPTPPTVVINNTLTGDKDTATPIAQSELTALSTRLTELVNSTNQGTGLTFQSWNALGISFSQKFERPVVIAMDSIEARSLTRPECQQKDT